MNAAQDGRRLHFPPEFRHAWAFFVVIGGVNLVILWWQFRARIALRPDLAPGYRRYLIGLGSFLTLPWLVMGYGIEVGGVPQPFSFLHPPEGNPYIFAFNAVITALLVLACFWVCVGGGAEFFLTHPGTLGRNMPASPVAIRLFSAFMLAGWLAVLTLRWLHLLPDPPI